MKYIAIRPITCDINGSPWLIVAGETFEESHRIDGMVYLIYKSTIVTVREEDYTDNYILFKGEIHEEIRRLYH